MSEDKIIYIDMSAHKVITADINLHPYIEIGSGKAVHWMYANRMQHLSNHLESVCTEGTTLYVTDVACGIIKMMSRLNGTISLLLNLRKL